MSTNQVIRPLGPLFSAARHALGFMTCVVVTYRYIIPSDLVGPENADKLKSAFEQAVARTVEKLTPLQVGIDDEDIIIPNWKRLSALELGRHITWLGPGPREAREHDELLRKELEAQHNTRFLDLARQPGWRLVNLPSHSWDFVDAMFAWHHAYTDATGATIFHQALLEALTHTSRAAGPTTLRDDGTLGLPRDAALPPIVQDAVKFTFSVPFVLKTIWTEFVRPWFLAPRPPEHPPWEGGPITKTSCKTNLRLAELGNSLLQNVLQACRDNQTTLTGLLHALILTSLARSVPASEARAFACATPISLRRHFNTPNTASHRPCLDPNGILGNYVTSSTHMFGPDVVDRLRSHRRDGSGGPVSSLVWDIARQVRGELAADVMRLPADDNLGLGHLVRDWKVYVNNHAAKPREWAWEVSNLGAVDTTTVKGKGEAERRAPSQGDAVRWRVKQAVFSQGALVAGAAIAVSVLGIKGGNLAVACSWQDGVVATEIGTTLVSDLQEWLYVLGNGGSLVVEEGAS